LNNGVHCIKEGLLNVGNLDGQTSGTTELDKGHTNRVWSEDKVLSHRDTECNFSCKVGRNDRTRFIEDQSNIHHSVALLWGTIPARNYCKRTGIESSEVGKVNGGSIRTDSSARKTIGSIGPKILYGVSRSDGCILRT